MKLTIEINLDNAAFHDNPGEVRDVLNRACEASEQESFDDLSQQGAIPLYDTNGNRVGQAEFTE